MKYKKGDKFIYQVEGKSTFNGQTLTILSGNESDLGVMYFCKIGCCQRASIPEENLDKMKIIPVAPLNNA